MHVKAILFGMTAAAALSLGACGDSSAEGLETTTFHVEDMGARLKLL